MAFEALAVVTVAPRLAADLGGLDAYGWIFSAFLLASLPGIVWAGAEADRRGPARPLALALGSFAAGLVLAGLAPSMTLVIAARALQGLGGGALGTLLYVAITRAYSDAERPRMLALLSSAWVLPALLGPAAAGLVADTVGWRAVFLGVVPLLALTAWLTLPAYARFRPRPETAAETAAETGRGRLRLSLRLAGGAALALAGLGALALPEGGAAPSSPLPLAALGVAPAALLAGGWLALPALARLLPAGTLRARPGLPAVIAARLLAYSAFVGAEALLSLTLIGLQGRSAATAGGVLAVGALSWTVGAWVQERLDVRAAGRGRRGRIAAGALLVALGLALQVLAPLAPGAALALAVGGWFTAGLGMGLVHATSSVLAFALAADGAPDGAPDAVSDASPGAVRPAAPHASPDAPPHAAPDGTAGAAGDGEAPGSGAVAASLQLADQLGAALSTGVAGAGVAVAAAVGVGRGPGAAAVFALFALAALTAVGAARRRAAPT